MSSINEKRKKMAKRDEIVKKELAIRAKSLMELGYSYAEIDKVLKINEMALRALIKE